MIRHRSGASRSESAARYRPCLQRIEPFHSSVSKRPPAIDWVRPPVVCTPVRLNPGNDASKTRIDVPLSPSKPGLFSLVSAGCQRHVQLSTSPARHLQDRRIAGFLSGNPILTQPSELTSHGMVGYGMLSSLFPTSDMLPSLGSTCVSTCAFLIQRSRERI